MVAREARVVAADEGLGLLAELAAEKGAVEVELGAVEHAVVAQELDALHAGAEVSQSSEERSASTSR